MWIKAGFTAVLLSFWLGGAQAQPPFSGDGPGKGRSDEHPGKGRGEHRAEHHDEKSDAVTALITATVPEADARELARHHNYTGFKPLPPGIRMNLERGKPLPPGIARTRGLSEAVQRDLPHYEGYEWQRAGTDLVLVSLGSQLIAEVLHDVFE